VWTPYGTATVAPRAISVIPLTCEGWSCQPDNLGPDRHPEDTGVFPGYAFRVTSNFPLVVYQVNSDDLGGAASSSSATLLIPVSALDLEYYAVTAPGNRSQMRGWVAVVAIEDDTRVTFRASAPTVDGGDLEALEPDDNLSVTLDDGDVLQVASRNDGADLSGSYVVADKAVAVFAGHECANLRGGDCNGGGEQGDHVEEQLPPVVAWGRSFIAARNQHQEERYNTDTLWKIVASRDGTVVTFTSATPWGGVPAESMTLDSGDVFQFTVNGTSGANSGHFSVEATEPILMMQFHTGETVMILTVPTEQFLPSYLFVAPPFFDDTLAITRPIGAAITLDGVTPSGFGTWVAANDTHEVMWIDALLDGSHEVAGGSVEGASFPEVSLVGMDINCSYGYVGGMNVERINEPM
jgi:hypothetical protein